MRIHDDYMSLIVKQYSLKQLHKRKCCDICHQTFRLKLPREAYACLFCCNYSVHYLLVLALLPNSVVLSTQQCDVTLHNVSDNVK